MSLRAKLLLIVLSIVGLTAVGEGLLLRSLTRDLEFELGEAVASVSQHLVAVIRLESDATTYPTARIKIDPGPDSTPISGDAIGAEPSVDVPATSGEDEAEASGRPVLIKRKIARGEELGEADLLDHLDALGVELSEDQRSLIVEGPSERRRVAIPTEGVELTLRTFGRKLLLGSMGVALLGLLLAGALAHRVTTPLQQLATAASEVGKGQLGVQVETQAGGEVGATLEAFNSMSRRLAELEADARELRANQHLSELGEIGRGLAHSLRNPLNTLSLAVGEIEHLAQDIGPSSTRAEQLASDARNQITRIDHALESFLALSTGPVESTETLEIDLIDLARDVALEALQTARKLPAVGDATEPIRIDVQVQAEVEAPAAPTLVRGFEAELRAALQALVINAVEASPPGGQVIIQVGMQADQCALTVTDEGPGLPDEVRDRLFSPHVTTKPQGAGIGLYLAHRIATNRYRGTLRLDPIEPRGTKATLTLQNRVEPGA